MKRTRFFCMINMMCCFLLAASTVFAQPERRGENFPDVAYSASPTRIVELDMVKQVIGSPEFTEFFDALTAKIDQEYRKVSFQPGFPSPIADVILGKVREAKGISKVSSKDVIELFFSEVELIQLEAYLKKAYDAGVMVPNNPETGKYFRVTFVTKFSPAELSGLLDILKPFAPVEMIKGEENDFLVSIRDPNQSDVKLFLGGQKIEALDRYAVVFSLSREMVEQKLTFMQNERARRFMFGENAAAKSLWVGKGFFEMMEADTQKKIDAGNDNEKDTLRIIKQVNFFSATTRDFDGKTGTRLRLVLADEKAVSDLKAMAEGGKAMLGFIANSDNTDACLKKLIGLLQGVEINQDGQSLTVAINWSDDELIQLAKEGLKKATAEIKK